MNRIDRLLATILLLQGRRCITAADIAGHFEISLRTVYRDIAALCEGGVPVVAEAGVGYSLLGGYHLPPVMFSAEEASALFLGGRLVDQLTDRSMQSQARSALLKIRAVLPRTQQEHVDRLESATELMLRPPWASPRAGTGAPAPAFLARIQSALAARRVLELRYRKEGEEAASRRAVEPLGLLFYADHWHLIAHCRLRGEIRDFRTDRMLEVTVSGETFGGRPGFSLRAHLDQSRKDCPVVEVVVRVASTVLGRFRRAWQGGIVDEQVEGERIRLTILGDVGSWMESWLLGFGTSVEVVSPPELRRGLAALAARVARHHGEVEATGRDGIRDAG